MKMRKKQTISYKSSRKGMNKFKRRSIQQHRLLSTPQYAGRATSSDKRRILEQVFFKEQTKEIA